ncbi:hypothetical protein PG991_007084 [Apiospora marii]|uniref:Uncharacterized protein n=1 Tax=Apiospora marii TaxID=335849 RepID=A0ABR1RZB6_9PEZI
MISIPCMQYSHEAHGRGRWDDTLQQDSGSEGEEQHGIPHAEVIGRVPVSLSHFLETRTRPQAFLHGAIHVLRLGPESREQMAQEGSGPWHRRGLTEDVVYPVDPRVCDIPKEQNVSMERVHCRSLVKHNAIWIAKGPASLMVSVPTWFYSRAYF